MWGSMTRSSRLRKWFEFATKKETGRENLLVSCIYAKHAGSEITVAISSGCTPTSQTDCEIKPFT